VTHVEPAVRVVVVAVAHLALPQAFLERGAGDDVCEIVIWVAKRKLVFVLLGERNFFVLRGGGCRRYSRLHAQFPERYGVVVYSIFSYIHRFHMRRGEW
jgi:hypothetical protein